MELIAAVGLVWSFSEIYKLLRGECRCSWPVRCCHVGDKR